MKGILFKEKMFKAVIEGRKTQTRRTVKGLALDWLDNAGFSPEFVSDPDNRMARYNTGEVVYLKEPYCDDSFLGSTMYKYLWHDNTISVVPEPKWKNKLFMPEKFARYFIKIIRVRCERLVDISADDVLSEGVDYLGKLPVMLTGKPSREQLHELATMIARGEYQTLWESINGKGSWELNPWVWVYEFRLIEEVNQ